MTERPQDRPVRARARIGPTAVAWGALALFLALLALLAARTAAGKDPALNARAAHTPLPARRMLVRRIYERRVIVHLPEGAHAQRSQSSQQQVAAAGPYGAPPVTRTS
jgi:hypothetical protein